jgi:hypothetical protein
MPDADDRLAVIAPSSNPQIMGRSRPSASTNPTTSSASRAYGIEPPGWAVLPRLRVSGAMTRNGRTGVGVTEKPPKSTPRCPIDGL